MNNRNRSNGSSQSRPITESAHETRSQPKGNYSSQHQGNYGQLDPTSKMTSSGNNPRPPRD